MDIRLAAQKRILILDGAMGTMIQRYKLQEEDFRNESMADIKKSLKGNNDLLSITRPEVIQAIHEEYLAVGADIVETNTFSGTTIAQEDYNCEHLVYEINFQSAVVARKACDKYTALTPDKPRFVAGSIGPTNKTASLSPDVNDPGFRAISFDELVTAFRFQIEALIDGGVDVLLFETIIDTLNAKAALYAVQEVLEERNIDIPIMVSGTITDASGRLLSGQTAEAFLISLSHVNMFSIGLNCALGADLLRPYVQALANNTNIAISAYPNAGLPNEFGEYDQTATEMSDLIKEYLDRGLVNVLGGCCGTTPEHIKHLADLAKDYQPRQFTVQAPVISI